MTFPQRSLRYTMPLAFGQGCGRSSEGSGMPLVFVHGVANRKDANYEKHAAARDAFLKAFVAPALHFVNGVAHVRQSPLDTAIPPRGILFGHTYDQLLHFLGDTRPAQRSSLLTPVTLLGDQSLGPAQEGVRRGKRGDLCEARAPERVGERGEAAAFCVGQVQPAPAKLGFQDTVFLDEIGENLLLVTLEPAGDHGDQDVEDHRRSSGESQ